MAAILFASMIFFLFLERGFCSNTVTTELLAPWDETPLPLEAAEYIAKTVPDKYWSFVSEFVRAPPSTTDRERLIAIMAVAGFYLAPLSLDLLETSLATHAFSPAVQAGLSVSQERITELGISSTVASCTSFFEVNGHVSCAVDDLGSLLTRPANSSALLYPIDHVYNPCSSDCATVLLYGSMSGDFKGFYEKAMEAASPNVQIVFRYYRPSTTGGTRMRLSGYGVELAVKKTEYKAVDDTRIQDDADSAEMEIVDPDDEVGGFIFAKLKKKLPNKVENLEKFREHLIEHSSTIHQLKPWDMQNLGLVATEKILQNENPLRMLQYYSQNYPIVAHTLVGSASNSSINDEIRHNQQLFSQLGVESGGSMLLLNGLILDPKTVNLFNLLDILGSEARSISGLQKAHIPAKDIPSFLSISNPLEMIGEGVLDFRVPAVVYMNDLEVDSRYRRWSSTLMELLRPAYPGQMRYVAKNIFTVVLICDLNSKQSREALSVLQSMIEEQVPIRFGVVFVNLHNSSGSAPYEFKGDFYPQLSGELTTSGVLVRAFSHVLKSIGREDAFKWLVKLIKRFDSDEDFSTNGLKKIKKAFTDKIDAKSWETVMGPDCPCDKLRLDSIRYALSSGLRAEDAPFLLFNGAKVVIDKNDRDKITTTIAELYHVNLPTIQRAAYFGEITDQDNILEFLLRQQVTTRRLSPLVLNKKSHRVLALADENDYSQTQAEQIPLESIPAALSRATPYLSRKEKEFVIQPVTLWCVVNLNSHAGRLVAFEALRHMLVSDHSRLALIHYGGEDLSSPSFGHLVTSITKTLSPDKALHTIGSILARVLTEYASEGAIQDLARLVELLPEDMPSRSKVVDGIQSQSVRSLLSLNAVFSQKYVPVGLSSSAVLVNMRIVAILPSPQTFSFDDFALLENDELQSSAKTVAELLSDITFEGVDPEVADLTSFRTDSVVKIVSLLNREASVAASFPGPDGQPMRRLDENRLSLLKSKFSSFPIHSAAVEGYGSASTGYHKIVAILNPLSHDTQKLSALLAFLHGATRINGIVYLNPVEKLSEAPIKRFYRFVSNPRFSFNEKSAMNPGPIATFSSMPIAPLLTLGLDTPSSWMVQSIKSLYDLDNIHLQTAKKGVRASFELEYILVEGSCVFSENNSPARGLQLQLDSHSGTHSFDTIVMANLGYFQLKAFPGAWNLRLRAGRSRDIFEIDTVIPSDANSHPSVIALNSFNGKQISVSVKRKPGKERAKLLDVDEGDGSDESLSSDDASMGSPSGIWSSVKSFLGVQKKHIDRSGETINIFSLASGHLYERFMKIMMLSVLKQTKNPVKFWFLKNCMSPQFKKFIPFMAAEYGFDYELVQYNWPSWLHQQTEKQRMIWGYKILFLDVLFPLNVKKIIFVDADQIVRADLRELIELDLGGAPYGYTPFCSDRTEMDGFRFWKSGFWHNHLQGRAYHISALYVIDLVRFREMAAGDRLREQYHSLSKDPNSLSNLDQDLPNSMIHQVPIKSLPQDWLWCETWCSDSSKKTAKTIDLCNNPLTKEPKLQAAVRIVSEWTSLDEEAKEVTRRSLNATVVTTDGSSHSHGEL